jgi:hypothetical protein
MRAREFVTEVDRRGFLKALGAGALGLAGVSGVAKADTTIGNITQHDNGATSYQAGPMRLTQNPDKSVEAEYRFYDDIIKAFRRGNVSGVSVQGPDKDDLINVVKTAQARGINTQSPKFQKFLQTLPGYAR